MHDIAEIREQLLDKDLGFHVMRNFFSEDEAKWLRGDCQNLLNNGRVLHTRINTDTIEDYVHPRSHDGSERTYRMYRYFHNHREDEVGRLLGRATKLRSEIEEVWCEDPVYKEEHDRLQDYVIVTSYKQNSGMLPIHRDYNGPAKLPLIQFWVLLSQPEVDYANGNLIVYSDSGKEFHAERDLKLNLGDAVVFDKSLEHKVEVCEPTTEEGVGRWTILIGARAERDQPWQAVTKKFMFSPSVFPITKAAKRMIGRRAA